MIISVPSWIQTGPNSTWIWEISVLEYHSAKCYNFYVSSKIYFWWRVVYFDQRRGAPHIVRGSKSFFCIKTSFFIFPRSQPACGCQPREGLIIECPLNGQYQDARDVIINGKSCFSIKKMMLTIQWLVEHPFAGQNTQQLCHRAKQGGGGVGKFIYSLCPNKQNRNFFIF